MPKAQVRQGEDRRKREVWRGGFTAVELLIVMSIFGLLASMALPGLREARDDARVARAMDDLRALASEIDAFEAEWGRYPSGLDEIGRHRMEDPWGRTYVYSPHTGARGARKDQFNLPINDDFDLWSRGPDRLTALSLVGDAAWDDVVRGDNGGFIGRASDY